MFHNRAETSNKHDRKMLFQRYMYIVQRNFLQVNKM